MHNIPHSNEAKRKMSLAKKGKKLSAKHIANRTKAQRGLRRSEETRKKISLSKMGNTNPLGHIVSEETRNKISEKLRGKKRSLEVRRQMSLIRLGHKPAWKNPTERNRKIGEANKISQLGKQLSEETKKKIRVAIIKRKEINGHGWIPNYNKEACEFFKSFDEANNTKGRYALYGNGEYLIEKLGYFPDYINFEKKLIMEYDEPRHYNENGNLKAEDEIREQEIRNHYPDFKFKRIKGEVYGK